MRKRVENGLYVATILGEPASKSNTRKIVLIAKKIRVIKSKKALNYLKGFALQCPVRDNLFMDDVAVGMHIYYSSRRPDLDESLILDALEGYAYKNDRQVKAKFILHGLDKTNPHTKIVVAPMQRLSEVLSIMYDV